MALQPTRGTVPHFSMRPHPVLTGAIILTVVVGLLVAASFASKEDGAGRYQHYAVVTLVITGILTVFLLILATSKMWFPHLWKKNSSHDRHKQHTRYHPAVKDREFRTRR
jgi:amino acid transporter